jgi:hypothetical protein
MQLQLLSGDARLMRNLNTPSVQVQTLKDLGTANAALKALSRMPFTLLPLERLG